MRLRLDEKKLSDFQKKKIIRLVLSYLFVFFSWKSRTVDDCVHAFARRWKESLDFSMNSILKHNDDNNNNTPKSEGAILMKPSSGTSTTDCTHGMICGWCTAFAGNTTCNSFVYQRMTEIGDRISICTGWWMMGQGCVCTLEAELMSYCVGAQIHSNLGSCCVAMNTTSN